MNLGVMTKLALLLTLRSSQ